MTDTWLMDRPETAYPVDDSPIAFLAAVILAKLARGTTMIACSVCGVVLVERRGGRRCRKCEAGP